MHTEEFMDSTLHIFRLPPLGLIFGQCQLNPHTQQRICGAGRAKVGQRDYGEEKCLMRKLMVIPAKCMIVLPLQLPLETFSKDNTEELFHKYYGLDIVEKHPKIK